MSSSNVFSPIQHSWGILIASAFSSGGPSGKKVSQKTKKINHQSYNKTPVKAEIQWEDLIQTSGRPLLTSIDIANVSTSPLCVCVCAFRSVPELHPEQTRAPPPLFSSAISISCCLLIITACGWCLIHHIGSPSRGTESSRTAASARTRTARHMWGRARAQSGFLSCAGGAKIHPIDSIGSSPSKWVQTSFIHFLSRTFADTH